MAVPPHRALNVMSRLIIILSGAGALLFCASLLIGPSAIGLSDTLSALFSDRRDAVALIVQEIRLPRAIIGILVGASLGLSGAALQGYLRNPLAEAGILGIAPAAALGAVLVFYTGLATSIQAAVLIAAMAGALVSVLFLGGLAARGSVLTLVLAGVAITSLAGALTSLVLSLSPNPFAMAEIVFWMLGSLADRSMDHVRLALPFVILGCGLLAMVGRGLDALSLGEDAAASMGINVSRTRWLVIIGAALCVGAATAVAGVVGFVGLVVPHLMRPLVGHLPSRLLLTSALGGACLVLAADVAVRLLSTGPEMKLGVITALIGGPFFLMLILRMRVRGAT